MLSGERHFRPPLPQHPILLGCQCFLPFVICHVKSIASQIRQPPRRCSLPDPAPLREEPFTEVSYQLRPVVEPVLPKRYRLGYVYPTPRWASTLQSRKGLGPKTIMAGVLLCRAAVEHREHRCGQPQYAKENAKMPLQDESSVLVYHFLRSVLEMRCHGALRRRDNVRVYR